MRISSPDWLIGWLIGWFIDWQVMKDAVVNQAGLFWETSFEDILKVRQFVTQEKKKSLEGCIILYCSGLSE